MESVILVRHGESSVNVQKIVSSDYDGYPLTERGVSQVKYMADQLSDSRISGIISSPVLRARQTADIISQGISSDYSIDERIRESGLGRYNNFRMTNLPRWLSHEELGMESWQSHIDRFCDVIESRAGRYILISHAYPIRAILSHYLGLGEHDSPGIEVRNATATVIDIEHRKVLCIGSTVLTKKVRDFISS